MFTGIVESVQPIIAIEEKGTNLIFTISEKFDEPLYIDQSIAHNGVCLTVIEISEGTYKVEAIKETLDVSNLGTLQVGDLVNQERSVKLHTRMDGHIVQGHVDETATCEGIEEVDGSWIYTFRLNQGSNKLVIPKGSITINGISLTVKSIDGDLVQVAIIPYTQKHTNLHTLKIDSIVNIEFDMVGKYVINYMEKINA